MYSLFVVYITHRYSLRHKDIKENDLFYITCIIKLFYSHRIIVLKHSPTHDTRKNVSQQQGTDAKCTSFVDFVHINNDG